VRKLQSKVRKVRKRRCANTRTANTPLFRRIPAFSGRSIRRCARCARVFCRVKPLEPVLKSSLPLHARNLRRFSCSWLPSVLFTIPSALSTQLFGKGESLGAQPPCLDKALDHDKRPRFIARKNGPVPGLW